ncbi:MAG: hypothetical protein HY901_06385 [Deltaproteobacteria bacterium]|nr:hypothetical protein [Deltaproteobacteria bacterium]
MTGLACLLALSLAGPAAAPEAPSDQALVFFNARLALREGRPAEVLKLWLLRNALKDQGRPDYQTDEFRSLVWAALGQLGLCQDGFREDEAGGAGLWPLALHNWVVSAMGRPPPDEGRDAPFNAFESAEQQRLISLHDVLSHAELKSATFFKTSCGLPKDVIAELPDSPSYDPTNRLTLGALLRHLLEKSLQTLQRERVRDLTVIQARIFDLDLALAKLQERKVRQEYLAKRQQRRRSGIVAAPGAEEQAVLAGWTASSEQVRFLRESLSWPAADWLNLNRQRRLALFAQARKVATDQEALEKLLLDLVDALSERGGGEEVEQWLGYLDAQASPQRRSAVAQGERGRRLLQLAPAAGFRERAVLALHRGVAFLEKGERGDALRSFAFAMAHAEESREEAVVMPLARRWLSFVLSRYETNDEILATLKALVPKREYGAVVEDLLWRAALRIDEPSFERVAATIPRGGALDSRVSRLRPLAQGKAGEMIGRLRDDALEEPFQVLRFVRLLLEHLEAEEADVRRASVMLLRQVLEVLDTVGAAGAGRNAQVRVADELSARVHSVLEGLGHLDASAAGKARALSVRHEAFAGSIRLAPADELPWPFRVPQVEAPSAFAPLVLEPIEWPGPDGRLVFGWRLHDPE